MNMAIIRNDLSKLPGRFEELVREMPPQAIVDDSSHDNAVEMIDRLMARGKLTKGQELYLETLVQLVQVYECTHHAIDTRRFKGVGLLNHLAVENGLTAAAIAKILGVHASMGSKLLKGERSLTIAHARALGAKFKVRFEAFLAE